LDECPLLAGSGRERTQLILHWGHRIGSNTTCSVSLKAFDGMAQEAAEQRLAQEICRIDELLARRAARRTTFADCAARYLQESRKRSVALTAWHTRLLLPYVGASEVHCIHDETLQSFISDRLASGVSATTIDRSLEVVRTILTRGLDWNWEVPIPEIGSSLFVIPLEAFRGRRAHVVILNDVATSIIEEQRGKHPIWVFSYRGKRDQTMSVSRLHSIPRLWRRETIFKRSTTSFVCSRFGQMTRC
jgi:hypothetical protein